LELNGNDALFSALSEDGEEEEDEEVDDDIVEFSPLMGKHLKKNRKIIFKTTENCRTCIFVLS
jgi:hypothetical protein